MTILVLSEFNKKYLPKSLSFIFNCLCNKSLFDPTCCWLFIIIWFSGFFLLIFDFSIFVSFEIVDEVNFDLDMMVGI